MNATQTRDNSPKLAANAPSLLATVVAEHSRDNLPVLYLSGPMTGHEEFNFPHFNDVARKLRFLGFPVLNPADFGSDGTHKECVARDLGLVAHADIVVLLEGWEASKGAGTEIDVAIGLGIPLVRNDQFTEKVLSKFWKFIELEALLVLDCHRQALGVGYDKNGDIVVGKRGDVRRLAALGEKLAEMLGINPEVDDEDDDDGV